jgi:lysophospholipase L1-like esterase
MLPTVRNGDRIVAIGDSITYSGGYLRFMREVLEASQMSVEIVNVGKSGEKAEQLAARFHADVVERNPQLCIISVGINDIWHRLHAPYQEETLFAFVGNVRQMVDAAQKANISVVLCTPTVIGEDDDPENEANIRLQPFCDAIRKLAVEKSCLLADLHSMFLEAIRAKPLAPGATKRPFHGYLTFDGVHMNGPGNWVMAEGILKVLGVPQDAINAVKPKG